MPPYNYRRSAAFLVPALMVSVTFSAGAQNVYVSNYGDDTIHEFSPTGTDLGTFATGANGPVAMAFTSSGNLLVTSFNNSTITEYSSTGANLGVFASTGLVSPDGIVITPTGNVLVTNRGADNVEEFSSTGTDLGQFATTGTHPGDIVMASNGHYYVSNIFDSTISDISSTGADLGLFASSGLSGPIGLTFDSSGNLYVGNSGGGGNVEEYSSTGTDLGNFVTTGVNSYGIAFNPAGDLLVSDQNNNLVKEYSSTGASLGNFASTGLNNPTEFAFDAGSASTPEPGTVGLLIGGLGSAGAMLLRRRRASRTASARK